MKKSFEQGLVVCMPVLSGTKPLSCDLYHMTLKALRLVLWLLLHGHLEISVIRGYLIGLLRIRESYSLGVYFRGPRFS